MTKPSIRHATLYHYPISRSARVRMLLEELRLDHEVVRVDLMRGEAMSADYLAMNPNHAVPVLKLEFEDGPEQVLFESGAMIVYLADLMLEAGLAPALDDVEARGDYLQTIFWNASHIDTLLWNLRLHRDLFPKPIRSEATVTFNMDKLQSEIVPQLEARLSEHDWICGDAFTAADCIMAQNVGWMRAYGIGREGAVNDYAKRLQQRPSWRAAYADAREFEA